MKIKTGDISIVENAGTFLLWYDTPGPHQLTATLPARYTLRPSGEILETPRTVKERR